MPRVDWSSQMYFIFLFFDFFTLLIGCTCTVVLQNKRERGSGWTLDGSNWSSVWQRSMTSITRVSLLSTRSPPESETAFCSRSNLQVHDFREFFYLVVTRHCKSLRSFNCGITVSGSRRFTILRRACEVYVCKLEFGRRKRQIIHFLKINEES